MTDALVIQRDHHSPAPVLTGGDKNSWLLMRRNQWTHLHLGGSLMEKQVKRFSDTSLVWQKEIYIGINSNIYVKNRVINS